MLRSSANCSVMIELPPELVEVICFKPGNLAELPFQRRRDGRSHHIRAGAGIERDDLDGRIIDLRQRRNRQLLIGDDADQQNRRPSAATSRPAARINIREGFISLYERAAGLAHANSCARLQFIDAVDDDGVAGRQPCSNRRRVALSESDFDIAGFDATVRLDDVNVS